MPTMLWAHELSTQGESMSVAGRVVGVAACCVVVLCAGACSPPAGSNTEPISSGLSDPPVPELKLDWLVTVTTGPSATTTYLVEHGYVPPADTGATSGVTGDWKVTVCAPLGLECSTYFVDSSVAPPPDTGYDGVLRILTGTDCPPNLVVTGCVAVSSTRALTWERVA